MRKKLMVSVLAVALAFSMLTACGNKEGSDSKVPEGGSGSVVEGSGQSGSNEESAPPEKEEGTEENYDGRLVFDHSMELEYARNFSVDYYKGGYKEIKTVDGTKILLVPENMSVPAEAGDETIVLQQPVSNILVSSTPTTSLINAIGALDAVSLNTYDVDSWYIDEVKEALTSGKMTYIGNYKEPDYELITASGTTFSIFSTMLTEDVAEQLKNLGVKILLDRSGEEAHPLARVEWMKLYGAMFNLEDVAQQKVDEQIAFVNEIAKKEKTGKTVAICYITSKGLLYTRNADDYMAQMVNLAGGEYVLSNVGVGETGTLKMEMEAFYDGAKDADYLIYIWSLGGKPETLEDMLAKSDVFADMKAVKEGNVWCTTPDYFQISDTIGSMINDINLMLTADDNTDSLTYLKKLK